MFAFLFTALFLISLSAVCGVGSPSLSRSKAGAVTIRHSRKASKVETRITESTVVLSVLGSKVRGLMAAMGDTLQTMIGTACRAGADKDSRKSATDRVNESWVAILSMLGVDPKDAAALRPAGTNRNAIRSATNIVRNGRDTDANLHSNIGIIGYNLPDNMKEDKRNGIALATLEYVRIVVSLADSLIKAESESVPENMPIPVPASGDSLESVPASGELNK